MKLPVIQLPRAGRCAGLRRMPFLLILHAACRCEALKEAIGRSGPPGIMNADSQKGMAGLRAA